MVEQEIHTLRVREHELSKTIPSTAASWKMVSGRIHFPNPMRGKVILDIGSGLSPVIFELRKRKAIAFGLDPRYESIKVLRDSSERYLEDINEESGEDYFPRVNGQKGSMELRFIADEKKVRESFLRHLESENPLIAGSAGNLPIKDNSIDFVFSINAISPGLRRDLGVFMKSIYEAYRVLVFGGEFQMYPLYLNSPSTSILLEALERFGIKFGFRRADFIDIHEKARTLRIFKTRQT